MEIFELIREYATLEALYKLFSIAVIFDIVTGLTNAWKQGEATSHVMRDGLFASFGEVVLLAFSLVVVKFIPITGAIIYALMCFMVLKEIGSILENLTKIGVNIPEWLIKGLKVYTDKLNYGEEK